MLIKDPIYNLTSHRYSRDVLIKPDLEGSIAMTPVELGKRCQYQAEIIVKIYPFSFSNFFRIRTSRKQDVELRKIPHEYQPATGRDTRRGEQRPSAERNQMIRYRLVSTLGPINRPSQKIVLPRTTRPFMNFERPKETSGICMSCMAKR